MANLSQDVGRGNVQVEEYLDHNCRLTLINMRNKLQSDLGAAVSKTSVHRALQRMLYSIKKLRIEKATMNSTPTNRNEGSSSRSCMRIYHAVI